MELLTRLLLRTQRWLQARAILLEPEQIAIEEGGRAAVAVALIVMLGQVSHYSELTWAAFGAFWTCLVDPGGPSHARLKAMALFAVSGAAAALLGTYTARLGLLPSTLALMAMVFLGGLYRLFGARATQAGVLASVVASVAADYPGPLHQDLCVAGIFLAGCLWAVFVCFQLWRTHPFQPARRAVGGLYRDLRVMCKDLEARCRDARATGCHDDTHRRAVRQSIERSRGILDRLAADSRDRASRHRLMVMVETGDRIFAGLVAVENDISCRPSEISRIRLAALLNDLGGALIEIGERVGDQNLDPGLLAASARHLSAYVKSPHPLDARLAMLFSESIAGLARCWAGDEARERDGSADLEPSADKAAGRLAWRHAARVAVTVAAARLIASRLGLPFGYWATVAVVVAMQPRIDENWPRMVERAVGSMAGGFLAALLWVALPAPSLILLAIFPLVAATIALRSVNYMLFVLFLSALFVLVADLGAPGNGTGIAAARACNNVLGSLLSLAGGFLLWRDPPRIRFEQLLASAVEANIDYVMHVLRGAAGGAGAVDAARRHAGIASNAAEIALQRRLFAGRRNVGRGGRTASLLAELRGLAGAATAAWLAGEVEEENAHLVAQCQALRHDLSRIAFNGTGAVSGSETEFSSGRIAVAIVRVVAQANLYAGAAA